MHNLDIHFIDMLKLEYLFFWYYNLKGLNGVIEIITQFNKNTYRTIYAKKIDDQLYVLHVFQKKSKNGIKIPKQDLELIRCRLQTAKAIARGEL